MNRHILLILLVISSLQNFKAQTFVYGQLTGSPTMITTGWNLNGNAFVGDTPGDVDAFSNELILTNALGNQSGGIFYNQPLNLSVCSKWSVEFDYRIWGGSAADGLAFCFLAVPPVGFVNGGGVGIPLTANGLKVVLDTWDNGCGNNPEIQIFSGVGYNECIAGIVKVNNIAGSLNFIRSNNYQHVKIQYNNGIVTVTINNTLYLTANFPINFPGYMGFTASTGGATDQHSIKNVIIYTEQAISNAGPDVRTCTQENVSIGTVNNPANIYSWSPATGLNSTTVSAPTVNITNSGSTSITQTYTVTTTLASNPGNCPTTDQVVVTIDPTFQTLITDTLCNGGPYLFNGNSITSSGIYVDTLSTIHGCDSIATLNIVISTTPIVGAVDQEICSGESVVLSPTGAPIYLWNPIGGPVDAQSNMTVTPNITTTYLLTGSNQYGCFSQDQVTVIVNPIPNVQLIANDPDVCPNTTINFNVSGADSYVWTGVDLTGFSGTTQSVTALNSGYYEVTGTTLYGCVASDSLLVTVFPLPVISAVPTLEEVCFGGGVSFQITGAASYSWSNGLTGSSYSYTPLVSEDFTVIGSNTFGCTDTTMVSVIVHPNPVASAIAMPVNLTSDAPFTTFTNNSTGYDLAAWNFGDGTSNTTLDQEIPHTFPYVDGNYQVGLWVGSSFGCFDSTTINISIQGDPIYYVPNTFTPDGDQFNNVFAPIFTTGFDPDDFHMMIFNRWGEVIFETYNVKFGWNGKIADYNVPDGIYSYQIKFLNKKTKENQLLQGHVNLLR